MGIYEKLVGYFEDGYKIFFGSYYGDDDEPIESLQELEWTYKDSTCDSLYIASVDVDDESQSVYVYVGDDE